VPAMVMPTCIPTNAPWIATPSSTQPHSTQTHSTLTHSTLTHSTLTHSTHAARQHTAWQKGEQRTAYSLPFFPLDRATMVQGNQSRPTAYPWLPVLLVVVVVIAVVVPHARHACVAAFQPSGRHTSNWAVIVSASKWWYNYRHATNALSYYHTARRMGIPDSNIILMLAEDVACNPRNRHPGTVYSREGGTNVYGMRTCCVVCELKG